MRSRFPHCGRNGRRRSGIVKARLCRPWGWRPAAFRQSAAQGAAADVAYVETVRGRVVASAQGGPTLLDALDIISDPTRLDLQAEQRAAYLPLPNAQGRTVEGAAASFDFRIRRDGGKRQGDRCHLGDVRRTGGLDLPGRLRHPEHRPHDGQCPSATEHQGRRSWDEADPQDSALGRHAADDFGDLRPQHGAAGPR